MEPLTRRQFFSLSLKLATLTGLGASALPKISAALAAVGSGTAPVLWLQGQSCSGCSVSLLNSEYPDPAALLLRYISLRFHATLAAASGADSLGVLEAAIREGGYLLAVEGSIPARMPEACVVGGEPFTRQVVRAARNAKAVLAVGTCASSGGIPAAENNPTGAVGVIDHLAAEKIAAPVIALPGCPVHPDWLIGTLVHLLEFGLPEVDEAQRPTMFFGRLVHDRCPRFADYEREKFAASFSDRGCFFKLGCVGTTTHADCTLRQWNGGTNFCIKAGSPCVGCTSEAFARKASFPLYRKTEQAREEKNKA